MNNKVIEAIIIGDEILAGRRQDSHLKQTINACEQRGLRLSAVHYLGDSLTQLSAAFRQTLDKGSIVLSFGGIGATPDDRTRQAIAQALALPLTPHQAGIAILQAKFGADFNAQRQNLVTFPQGSTLIPNPINQVPGFSIKHHHFVPGFPQMATPMIAWVLDQYYADLTETRVFISLLAYTSEGTLIPLLELLEQQFSNVAISCLPQGNQRGFAAEIGFEGDYHSISIAKATTMKWLNAQQITFDA